MVDWMKPIRSASTQRRLYMVGWDRIKRGYLVASLPGANPKSCALYAHDGQPLDTSVLGYVENVPEVSVGDPIVEIEHVDKANAINPAMREQRAAERRAAIAVENDSNPLWGMF